MTITVTGVITSADDGQPVIGASVLIKDTGIGTVTDIDGKFVLSNIPSNAKKIQISYVGMKPQEVSIKPNLIIVLESDSEMIDEVVVTGMQKMDKRLFTGASDKLSGEATKLDGSRILAVLWKGVLPVFPYRMFPEHLVLLPKSVYVEQPLFMVALSRCG